MYQNKQSISAQSFFKDLELPEPLFRLLHARGITNPEQVQNFFWPKLKDLRHPLEMKGVKEGAKLVCKAMEEERDIVIWGDYDVDGTTGTALLINFFKELGIEPTYYIPDRLTEGYGFNGDIFKEKIFPDIEGRFLLITVDCGISDSKEIRKLKDLNGDIIVTDHHLLPQGDIPDCIVINPSQDTCGFNGENPAGVGVAFFLAAALRSLLDDKGFFNKIRKPNLKNYLGFVALGTLADLVDITETNRLLIKAGLESLKESQLPGLRAVVESSGILSGDLNSEDVGFSIGPRINAAGRMGPARDAVEVMISDNFKDGLRLSKKLDSYNKKRKQICAKCYDSVLESLSNELYLRDNSVVVSGKYHSGIIGIVASRLVDKYAQPSIVFTGYSENGKELLKGSGRSVDGVNIVECIQHCQSHVIRFGGHAMAAGLTIERSDFEMFYKTFDSAVMAAQLNASRSSSLSYDMECSVDQVMNKEFIKYFSMFEPFGPGNERPVFLDSNASIVMGKKVGDSAQHLRLTVRGKYGNYQGIGFGLADDYSKIKKNEPCKLIFTPTINRYGNRTSWQLRIISIFQ